MEHLGTKTLETERLILRKFSINDSENMFKNWANNDDVTKYLTWPSHQNTNVSKTVIESWLENYPKNDFYNWAIILKEINEPIGSIGSVKQDDGIKMVHIGYCIGKNWWNKGIVSEALNKIINFFFNEVGVNRIESRHDPNNPNSGKVMVKCGMKYEGHMKQADKNNQGIVDTIYYGIIAKEYINKK
jgi:ribosomal-protein-alanine N-acetyltransferase